jgi:hypothetical protein
MTEPIESIPTPAGLIEAVRAQGGYCESTLDCPVAKVTAHALASETIGVR